SIGGGTVTLNSNTVQNNTASNGGGIYAAGGTVTMSSNIVQSNTAGDAGGGLYVAGASLGLSNDTVNSNTAPQGGGLYVSANGPTSTVTLTGVTVDSNKATGSDSLLLDCFGGGLYVGFGGNVTLSGCTVEFNAAAQASGGSEGLNAFGGGLF